MIEVADQLDDFAWLVDLEYAGNAGVAQTMRWTDAGHPIAVDGATYTPNNPVLAIGDINKSGSRLQRREWFVALADPAGTWQARYATGWRRKRFRLHLRTMPGPVVTLWKAGWCVGRQLVIVNDMPQVQLRFAGLFGRAQHTRKRLMNDGAQREVAADDDSLAHAQTSVDLNWGGN